MKNFLRAAAVPFLTVLAALIVLLCFAFALPALKGKTKQENTAFQGVLRVWQIDSFDGGTGSRGAFLKTVAKQFEKKNAGVYVLLTVHSPESAAYAVEQGEVPDLVSFGVGTDFVADAAVELRGYKWNAGMIGGGTYAIPWCRGQYFLFTKQGDFSDVSANNLLVSQGKGGVPDLAAYLSGIKGEYRTDEAVRAYVRFLQGECKYMLGSQRDIYRFIARGEEVTAKPLLAFSDLWQCAAICTSDAQRYAAAEAFLQLLLSDEVQDAVTRIGMLAVKKQIYGEENAAMAAAQSSTPAVSVSVFLTAQARSQLHEAVTAAAVGDAAAAKKIEKFLRETL